MLYVPSFTSMHIGCCACAAANNGAKQTSSSCETTHETHTAQGRQQEAKHLRLAVNVLAAAVPEKSMAPSCHVNAAVLCVPRRL